jgi:hypothetical protein
VRAGVGGGDDVPNLHCVIGYDHSVNQQLYQLAPLLEGGVFETAGQLLEHFGRRAGDASDRNELLTLRNHLPLAGKHVLLTLLQVAPLVLERRQIQNSGQIRLQQTRLLTTQSLPHAAQTSLTSAQFLWNPLAGPSPLQLMRSDHRVPHHLA